MLFRSNLARVALLIAMVSGTALFLFSIRADQNSSAQVSHIYFGTDTHSLGLFLGAALAVSWIPQNLTAQIEKRAQDVIDGIGVVGLIGMISCFLFIEETNAALYRIAFPLAAIFGCLMIISLVHPASRFAPIISNKPFLWIGERSYGIYIWHWVIFQVTRPSVDLSGQSWALYLARILLVLALADISLRWVELPFRRGHVQDWLRGIKYRPVKIQVRQRVQLITSIFSILIISVAVSIQALNRADAIFLEQQKLAAEQTNAGETNSAYDANNTSDLGSQTGLWVTGDSVILGIRAKLEAKTHISLVNARVGRQAPELLAAMQVDQIAMPKSIVIFNLGNNNKLTEETTKKIFEVVKNQPKIIVVNTAVPRPWRDENNKLIEKITNEYSNAKLIDWNLISKNHPEFFAPDGVHLSPTGSDVYVAAVLSALNS